MTGGLGWIGMLWFDPDKTSPIVDKITKAADFYQAKYYKRPDVVFLNPGELVKAGSIAVDGITVQANKHIKPEHFWLGVSEAQNER